MLRTHHVLAADGLPTAYRPLGEPLFIAAVYKLCGQHIIFVKLLQELLLTTLAFFAARFTRLLGMTTRQANLAALLVAFHPALAYAATTVYPTVLTAVALTAGVLYCALAVNDRAIGTAVKGGLALGINGLLTTTFTPLPVLIGFYLLYKRQVRIALVIGILGFLPSLVWLVRNRVVMGSWVLATNGGFNLIIGSNDAATPMSGNWVEPPYLPGARSELGYDEIYSRLAYQWIRKHPAKWVKLSIARGLLVVDSVGRPNTKGMHSGLGASIVGWLMLPVVLLGYAGLILHREALGAKFVLFALSLVIVSSAMTILKPRFRFPCDPLLSTFAVGTLVRVRQVIRDRRPDHCDPTLLS